MILSIIYWQLKKRGRKYVFYTVGGKPFRRFLISYGPDIVAIMLVQV